MATKTSKINAIVGCFLFMVTILISINPVKADETLSEILSDFGDQVVVGLQNGTGVISEKLLEKFIDRVYKVNTLTSKGANIAVRRAMRELSESTIKGLSADIIVALAVDVVADAVMEDILSQDVASVVKVPLAATAYITIKSSYVFYASKGNLPAIAAGQTMLLAEIAKEDIVAIQAFREARKLERYADLRADMWDAYSVYVNTHSSARDQNSRDLAYQQFTVRLDEISREWNIYDVISPGAGSLDVPGQRPGDVRYRSDLAPLFEDIRSRFSELSPPSLLEVQVNQPPTPYAPIYWGTDRPFVPALAGASEQSFALVSYYAEAPDLTEELQAEIVDNAPRQEPPPFPGQSPLYDNAHGFLAGGFGLNYNQTFSRDMVPVIENGVTKFRFSENNGNGSFVLVPLNERTSVDFSYLSWGTDRAVAEEGSGSTLPFIDQVFWLYGEQTPSTVLESRTGTADFSGNVYGHYYRWPSGGASTVDYDAVTGTLTFSADFTDDTITGDGEFNIAASGENFSETFALLGTLSDDNVSFVREFSGSEGGLQYYVGSAANIVTELTGTTGSGHMTGSFYGPDGLEAGGNISYFFGDRESAIAGVFVAQHGDAPEPFGNVTAFMTSSDYSGNIWDNGGDMDRRPTNNSVPYEEIHLPSIIGGGTVTASSVHTRDGYSYMSWGMWSANDSTPVSRENGGYWVAGEQTPESVVQGRTGSANYSGEINGDHVSGGIRREMGGTIELTADFNSDVITGEMQMHSSVASTPNFEISAPINGSGFAQMSDGSTNGYGAGFGINGAFLGPNADEIAGTVWSGGGPTDSWNGIFFADQ